MPANPVGNIPGKLYPADFAYRKLEDKPSVSLTPAPEFKAPGILSRADVLRRRQESDRPRAIPAVVAPVAMATPTVEMHAADMTPLPKNKGGRPRKV